MKRSLIPMMVLLCLATAARAQVATPDGRIEAHDVTSSYSQGQITVSMQLDATKAALDRREAIVLTPVIRSAGNERELVPVVVSGRNRAKADKRHMRFHQSVPYNPMRVSMGEVFPYNGATAWEPWMPGATLTLKEQVYGCASKQAYSGSATLMTLRAAEPAKPSGLPAISYIAPAVEAVKIRNMSGKAFLDFPVGKSVILSDFRNNHMELSKIRTMIDSLHHDPDVTTDDINLRGYASPEGSYATNQRLSQQRSEALRSYLQAEYGYPTSMFSVSSGAEDWEGLKTLIEKSELPDRDAALEIIRTQADPDAKERRLKALVNSYQKMLKNYFPQLHRVEYRLDYTVRAFSIEEGKQKIATNPGQMSLNEMFLVANTYPKGSDSFNHVFDVAVRLFPSDTVANINQAAILLSRGDGTSAHRYLDPFVSCPASWNNQGVMYLLEGNYDKAEEFFEKAKAAGAPEAAANQALLEQWIRYAAQKKAYDAFVT